MEGDFPESAGHCNLEPLAIIGLAFEFPTEATSEESFWQMIHDGRSASTEFPKDRINIDAFYHPDESRQNTIPLRGGNFVAEELGAFDAPFFSITPAEAACMDPQHRRMLETAYHALEDAGIPLERCSGSDTSVYTGCFTNDYLSILQQDYEAEQRHAAMGIAPSMLANRLSWFFNFKGISMNLDSACSSSLIALHLACQDLRAGSASMALVGGANLVYHPDFMKMMSSFNFLSPDSQCHSFDERANGYARGEGIAVIIIKRLSIALQDGDTIRAIIRNTGSNQDGRTPGITQPSEEAQINLINRTYGQANISMEPTRFFEAHGTGTPAGDPIEANAIGKAFRHCRSASDPLYVGAVKASIGHTEGCSGLAGIIKALLVLEKGIIPPIAGFESLNHQINADELHLKFPKSAITWPNSGLRRVCVNSFGFGGTNATAILDDACHYLKSHGLYGHHRTRETLTPRQNKSVNRDSQLSPNDSIPHCTAIFSQSTRPLLNGSILNSKDIPDDLALLGDRAILDNIVMNGCSLPRESISKTPKVLVWSAFEKIGTEKLSDAYHHYANQHSDEVENLAYTLARRRSHLRWRSFAVADTHDGSSLNIFKMREPVKATKERRVAFVFTGQGAQYLGMGRELTIFPVFRQSLSDLEACLKQLDCPWSLHEVISANNKDLPVDQPCYSQPLTTCLQIALVDLFHSFNITPSLLVGHSSGEIAAAYAAGALSRFSAIKVAYHRGVLSSSIASKTKGLAMMAVGLSREDVAHYIARLKQIDNTFNVSIGCVNSPKSITLTGIATHLSTLEQWFKTDSIFAQKLRVPVAYHSRFMDVVAGEYCAAMGTLTRRPGSSYTPMISSVTGDVATAEDLSNPDYWVRNMTSTVEFHAAFSRLLAQSDRKPHKQLGRRTPQSLQVTDVLEIGPHSTLQRSVHECLQAFPAAKKLVYHSSLDRNQDACIALLKAVGTLHCYGYPVRLLAANNLEKSPKPIPVDMPRYPFNHRQSYWKESRLSKNFRFRKFARHDLLGTRSLDWNPQVAQWRNIMRLTEMPWLEDHKIQGEVVFPAAGMIVMATEALRQVAENPASLGGIQMKNVSFLHPIIFAQETDKVETQLNLLTQSASLSYTSWSQFRLFVIEENKEYVECCSGFIRTVEHDNSRDKITQVLCFTGGNTVHDWMQDISNACQGSEQDPYTMPSETVVKYGPCFQVLEHMHLSGRGEAVAEVKTDSWKTRDTSLFAQSHVIHPTTLDGLAQLLVPALAKGAWHKLPTMVPVRVASIWIECGNGPFLQGKRLRAAAKCRLSSHRGASADIVGTSVDSNNLLLYIEGLETIPISSVEASDDKEMRPRNLCTRLVRKPDINAMSDEQISRWCTNGRPKGPKNAVRTFKALTCAIMSFCLEAVEIAEKSLDLSPKGQHLEHYISWMKYQEQRLYDGELLITIAEVKQILGDHDARRLLIRQVEDSGVEGNFFMHIGQNLIKILHGEVDALDLMFRNGLADRYYEQMLANEYHAHPASAYINLLCFKNPSMNILEVGAGTGGQTLRALEAMATDSVKKWAQYDYTDISAGFFGQARIKFEEFADQMNFRVLNISEDPNTQGFEQGKYDLVLASHVLHATDDVDQSLRNIRKLLNIDGKLLLFETTQPEALHIGFAFGLLKGWWSPVDHDPRSKHSPCLTSNQWNQRLRNTGFSGVDVEFAGQEEWQCRYSSIIISTAIGHANGVLHTSPEIALLKNPDVEIQCTTARLLEGRLASCKKYTLAELAEANLSPSTMIVFLIEMNAIFLDGISASDYNQFQSVLVKFKNTVWVTKTATSESEPQHHLADGLGRTLASEDATRKFVTLALEGSLGQDPERLADLISDLVLQIIKLPVEDLETNYVETGGMLEISRISENSTMDRRIAQAISPRQQVECQLPVDMPVSLRLGLPGLLHTLKYCEDVLEESLLGEDEIVVEVRAFGLTVRDYLVATGQVDEVGLGTECAGVVQAVGSSSSFHPGDRVSLIGASMSHTRVRTKASAVALIPRGMAFAEAASFPNALWLSYHAFVNMARLQRGEIVLILQATSSVGQMAIQLARELGANVLVTAGSPSKREFLFGNLGVPEAAIFDSDDRSLLGKIWQATFGNGVDVVVGPLSDITSANFSECLSPFGRLIDIGLKQHVASTIMPSHGTAKNISQASVNMSELLRKKPAMTHKTFQRAMKMGLGARFRPPQPIHVFPARDVEVAFRLFQDCNTVGKKIIELAPEMTMNISIKTKPTCNFSANATYVIGGGLGGLGRSFARWMASRGARNLILLSRSGVKNDAARTLVTELEVQGVCVAAPQCDISDIESLHCILNRLAVSMPPVKGCIQATVALRDNMFENMTYEDWQISTRSKVTGSWNLHQALPQDLDFFVLLSSLNGIFGGRAQANYAAGNTFKDALAHHRITHGQKAVSINLGLMVAEGVVAENQFLLASMRRIGHLMDIAQNELIALLDHYCDSNLPLLPDVDAQILVGIELPSEVLAKGIDLHHSIYRPLFRHLFRMGTKSITTTSSNVTSAPIDRATLLKGAASQEDAATLATEWFSAKVGQVLGLSASEIDPSKPVHAYGVDSLVAIDLKNWLEREVGAEITVFELLGKVSLGELGALAASKSRFRQ